MTRQRLTLDVNGQQIEVDADADDTLLKVLRGQMDLRGSKEACGRGECGACTVLYDGVAIASCVMPAAIVSKPVRTIEGLAVEMTELRERIADAGGFQCGFCTPGHVVRAAGLQWSRISDKNDLRRELAGNICRCTGYNGLVEAIWAGRPTGRAPQDLTRSEIVE